MVKNLPTMQEMWVWSLGQEDPLEEETATHSSILAWRIPWSPMAYSPWGRKELDMPEYTCLLNLDIMHHKRKMTPLPEPLSPFPFLVHLSCLCLSTHHNGNITFLATCKVSLSKDDEAESVTSSGFMMSTKVEKGWSYADLFPNKRMRSMHIAINSVALLPFQTWRRF